MMSPELILIYELALKMAMTAVIVVVISVVVERSGPFIGALIAALPTAASAAYIILAFRPPPGFRWGRGGGRRRRNRGSVGVLPGLFDPGATPRRRAQRRRRD